MALKLTLKPNEPVIVNGCVIRNSNRRHVLLIESQADVVRGHDMLSREQAATPTSEAYFLVQTALIRQDLREKLVPEIQKKLAVLATVFAAPRVHAVFEAASYVSFGDYYKALRVLRPLMDYEAELFEHAAQKLSAHVPPVTEAAP